MSRRETNAKKYAFVQFNCDGKTMQLKTKDLKSRTPLQINSHVQAPWEGKHLRAVVLGLSNDPTDLNQLERDYMKSLKTKGLAKNQRTAQNKKSTSILKKAKSIKRKVNKGIEFFPNDQSQPPCKKMALTPDTFNLSGLTSEEADKVRKSVETFQPSSAVNTSTSNSDGSAPILTNLPPLYSVPPPATLTLPVSPPATLTRPVLPPRLLTLTSSVPETLTPPIPLLTFPTPDLTSPTPDLTSPTPDLTSPTPDLTSPTPDLTSPSSDLTSPSPDLTSPSPDLTSPSPDLTSTSPDLTSTSPDLTSVFPLTRFDDGGCRSGQNGLFATEVLTIIRGMASHIQRLEDKLDRVLCANSTVCSSTQTEPEETSQTPPLPASQPLLTSPPPCQLLSASPPSPALPPLPPLPASPEISTLPSSPEALPLTPVVEEPFNDQRFWLLRPEQLSPQVTRDNLMYLTSKTVHFEPVEDSLQLTAEEISKLVRKSHNPSALARNILFHTFTMRELYNRNASGINYVNGQKKKALNPSKMESLVTLVRLHYDQTGLERIVHSSINKALQYLWGRKLKLPWLNLETM